MGVELRGKETKPALEEGGRKDFKYDLKLGEVGEGILGELLTLKKIEVKRDFFTSMTGNIAVEFSSRGKPSGIATTEADWWAFIICEDKYILLIETQKLKKIARIQYKAGQVKKGGDNQTSELVIIPVKDIIDLLNYNGL